jgi:hypothetical protein
LLRRDGARLTTHTRRLSRQRLPKRTQDAAHGTRAKKRDANKLCSSSLALLFSECAESAAAFSTARSLAAFFASARPLLAGVLILPFFFLTRTTHTPTDQQRPSLYFPAHTLYTRLKAQRPTERERTVLGPLHAISLAHARLPLSPSNIPNPDIGPPPDAAAARGCADGGRPEGVREGSRRKERPAFCLSGTLHP